MQPDILEKQNTSKQDDSMGLKHMPDSKANHIPHLTSSTLLKDPGLFSYILPSYSNILFSHLHRLQEDGLLLDWEKAQCLTPVGLRAVLDFAYCGYVAMDLRKEGLMEEVLNACRYLEMQRLMQKCTAPTATSAATELDKSLMVIRDMWQRGVGCDVTIQAESGERYAGKKQDNPPHNKINHSLL
uniref:BTB domain-containing protein n=1 Tax=Mastacembelus armatus TaxID=205130 RepID=A0A7N8WZL6_9TELE